MSAGHEEHHRNLSDGWIRAAVFGVSDGLVTNLSLILGFAGAHPHPATVRLAGLAGLVAGGFSMATGEYISMTAQRELFEKEIEVERKSLAESPEDEIQELIEVFLKQGISDSTARLMASEVMANPEAALRLHAREELGIDPSAIGSSWRAASSSFVAFSLGASVPLFPWFWPSTWSIWLSISLGAVASLAVGAVTGIFSGRGPVRTAVRQLAVTTLAAGVTYGVGHLIGPPQ